MEDAEARGNILDVSLADSDAFMRSSIALLMSTNERFVQLTASGFKRELPNDIPRNIFGQTSAPNGRNGDVKMEEVEEDAEGIHEDGMTVSLRQICCQKCRTPLYRRILSTRRSHG